MNFLKGRKTYIIAIFGGIATAVHLLGYIDGETYGVIMGALGAGGLATLRMGVAAK